MLFEQSINVVEHRNVNYFNYNNYYYIIRGKYVTYNPSYVHIISEVKPWRKSIDRRWNKRIGRIILYEGLLNPIREGTVERKNHGERVWLECIQ